MYENYSDNLPPEYGDDLLPEIRQRVAASGRTVVVLDDDPTGTQTVHDVPVLTQWTVEALAAELGSPCFYILTNSRSLPLDQAQALNREIGQNLRAASAQTGHDYVCVSRSDSTLRGHFPGEVEALVETLPYTPDAWLVIPFFLEGGRYTVGDVHYVADGDRLIPAAETPFAQDPVFGYQSSNLRDYIQEKTGGRVRREDVATISIDDLRLGGPGRVTEKLLALPTGAMCAVNAASYRDMEVFVRGLLDAEAAGKQYVYRTAASFVRTRIGQGGRDLLTREEMKAAAGGLVIVGSYVPKTTAQLEALKAGTDILPVPVNVAGLLSDADATIQAAADAANRALADGRDVVVYTSRELVTASSDLDNLSIGQRVSNGLIAVLDAIEVTPQYLIAKGGITSSDVATRGLGIRRAMVRGQIIPGVPVWETGPESRFPGMMYVVFPGNVGDNNALAGIVRGLSC